MDPDERSDGAILELSSEYTDLRFTLRHLRSQIDEAEERLQGSGRGGRDDLYLASLREQYSDGKRRIAEIRGALAPLEPVTFEGMKAKAVALEAEKSERGPSLRRAIVAATKGTRRR
jgi:hypothetical protein